MIYLDNAATTKVHNEVIDEMVISMKMDYANPSSLHKFGHSIEKLIHKTRTEIADQLGVLKEELYFTSGGTESNNLAIQGSLRKSKNGILISSKIEHPSVFECIKELRNQKRIIFLEPDMYGRINVTTLDNALQSEVEFLSVMHVNNELGTINPIEEIGQCLKAKCPSALYHVDGVQGFGKISLNFNRAKVDLYSFSGHKVGGPKGIGALYIRKNTNIHPIFFGGGQERGFRPGTENVPGIVGLRKASEIAFSQVKKKYNIMLKINRYFREGIKKIPGSRINSPENDVSPYILNVGFRDVQSEVLLHMLEQKNIYVSSGSACNKNKISLVLETLPIPMEFRSGCIRISFFSELNKVECDYILTELMHAVQEMRKLTGGRV